MSKSDTFGYIYESVLRSANEKIIEESSKVQTEQFEKLEKELEVTRRERNIAMKDFSVLNSQLESHVNDQKKVKILALSGFCMGMISLTSVVLSNMFDKR